ncbi:MFS transporter [Flindersiella endophytica]
MAVRLLGANRDFTLLWVGQAVSALGSAATLVAYPLLVLQLTGSPSQVGLVMAAGVVVQLLVSLPGGVIVDRYDKRRLMLACDAGRFAAAGVLGVAVLGDWLTIWLVLAVVIVDSGLGAVFGSAEPAAVRQVVAGEQLPLALARNEARGAAAGLAGPVLGGALLALARPLPFLANALSHLVSFSAVAGIRTPMPSALEPRAPIGVRTIVDGLRWIWRERFLRVTLLLISGNNLVSNAVFVLAIVVSSRRGDSAAATGLLVSMAGVGTLAGALVAPWLVRRLSIRTILIANRGAWLALVPLFAFVHETYAMGAIFAVMFLLGPTGNAAVVSRQLTLTPDELQGRVSSARGLLAGLAGPIGAGLAGVSVDRFGLPATVAALCGWLLVMLCVAGGSRAVRDG